MMSFAQRKITMMFLCIIGGAELENENEVRSKENFVALQS